MKTPEFLLPAACAALLLLGACAGEPRIQRGSDAEVIMGSLNRVDNAGVDLAYADPLVDYRRYERLRIRPLNLDHVRIVQPEGHTPGTRLRSTWVLTEEDRQSLQESFARIMRRELSGDGFTLTDEAGPDVMDIEAMLTRIAPNAPKDDLKSRGSARTVIYTQGAGSVSIKVTLRDAQSGEILALLEDRRDGETTAWGLNDRVRNQAEVRRIFSLWAQRLRRGLTDLRAM